MKTAGRNPHSPSAVPTRNPTTPEPDFRIFSLSWRNGRRLCWEATGRRDSQGRRRRTASQHTGGMPANRAGIPLPVVKRAPVWSPRPMPRKSPPQAEHKQEPFSPQSTQPITTNSDAKYDHNPANPPNSYDLNSVKRTDDNSALHQICMTQSVFTTEATEGGRGCSGRIVAIESGFGIRID